MKTKVVLSPDGDFIKIMEPSLTPAYLIRDVNNFHNLPSMHKIIANNIKAMDWQHTKVSILTLPGDMTCKIEVLVIRKGT
jgi:hypothetical protein